jgi:hypothetical protein
MYEVIQLRVLRLIRHPIAIVSIVRCRTSDIANHQPKGPKIPHPHVVRSDDLLPRLSILFILRRVPWSASHSVQDVLEVVWKVMLALIAWVSLVPLIPLVCLCRTWRVHFGEDWTSASRAHLLSLKPAT